jgi:recombination protein RecA
MTEPESVSIEDILASLDKETRSDLRLGSEIIPDSVPTASFGLNKELDGGFPVGKQTTVWGGEGSGKSGLMMQTVGINQAQGVPCAWIDSEGVFSQKWAERLGVDTDRLIYSRASTISDAANQQVKLIKAGVKLLVIDTTSELWPKSFVDKKGDLKDFDDMGQLGQQAKDLGQMSKMVAGINYSCAVVHISQQRVNVGSPAMHKPNMATGGKEIGHNDSVRIRLTGSKSDDKAIKAQVQRGSNLVEEVVGFPVDWWIMKNRVNGNEATGKYDFLKAENPGVNYPGEILDYAVAYGIADRSGSWVTIYDERVQGRTSAVEYLRSNPQVVEKLRGELDTL